MEANELSPDILLQTVRERALQGIPATVEEALALASVHTPDTLADVADEVRQRWCGDKIDTCSIVNARSGRCSENCKWCAQSASHSTGIKEYEFIPLSEALQAAKANSDRKVARFSLVTSGRKVAPADMDRFCSIFREIGQRSDISLCASMGLLSKDQLIRLREAGVRRYHCNLETSAAFFPTLCTTHSHADKLQTIAWAREAGMEVCSGGIIGMGETLRDRLELAEQARDAGACSIPVNILQPIKGTPLESVPLISEEEIILSVALMRLVAPKVAMRFAGGRSRLSPETTRRLLKGGISGSLVGDMLTTIGNKIDDDYALYDSLGRTH